MTGVLPNSPWLYNTPLFSYSSCETNAVSKNCIQKCSSLISELTVMFLSHKMLMNQLEFPLSIRLKELIEFMLSNQSNLSKVPLAVIIGVSTSHIRFNSLAPTSLNGILELISMTDGWGISWEIGLRWMLLDINDKSILVQVMAVAIRQQVITWANVDPHLCHHMASLGHNVLKYHMQTYPQMN